MVNLETLLTRILPTLNAAAFNDLVFWSKADLYQYADECIRDFSRNVAGQILTTLQFLGYGSTYNCDPAVLSVIHVSIDSRSLRTTNGLVQSVLSDTWATDAGPQVTHYLRDECGPTQIRVVPLPVYTSGFEPLRITQHVQAPTVSEASPNLAWPSILGDYIGWKVLAAARRADTEGSMPEISQAANKMASIMESIARAYWGEVQ
jgi:hypothetical protein